METEVFCDRLYASFRPWNVSRMVQCKFKGLRSKGQLVLESRKPESLGSNIQREQEEECIPIPAPGEEQRRVEIEINSPFVNLCSFWAPRRFDGAGHIEGWIFPTLSTHTHTPISSGNTLTETQKNNVLPPKQFLIQLNLKLTNRSIKRKL